MVYEVRLKLGTDEEGLLWPRRPQVGPSGLLGCMRNLPLRTYKATETSDAGTGWARFRCVAFSAGGDVFAAVDEKGRVFAFFPTRNRYALVCHLGTPALECAFSPHQRAELLVTCEDLTVRCVNVQTKVLVSTLRGHRHVPTCVSFQRPGQLALTASADAVILWDSADWSRFRTLNAGPGVQAAQFVNNGELVAVCFRDDSILMWELSTLALKYRFALPEYEHPPGLTRFCVSDNCRAIIASGHSPFIYVWEFESQTLIRIIELPATVRRVFQHTFVPCTSTIICVLGDDGQLNFLNVSTSTPKVSLQVAHRAKAMTHYAMDGNGKYLACCSSDGCLLLYDLDIARETAYAVQGIRERADADDNYLPTRSAIPTPHLMDSLFGPPVKSTYEPVAASPTPKTPTTPKTKAPSTPKTPTTSKAPETPIMSRTPTPVARPPSMAMPPQDAALQKRRLAHLLRSYEMYPERYRMLAWRFLLELPDNSDAFSLLLQKGVHPSCVHLAQRYPIQNQRLFRRLQRVLSAIAHWCPAFGEVEYLPAFVFPFIKVCENNDVMAFEVVASLLLFDGVDFLRRYPYPPLNLLRLLEKELERRDPQLYLHFVSHHVQADVYGWSLVNSAFSTVLQRRDWLYLWDHLVTPGFRDAGRLWAAVLAFLQLSRHVLLDCTSSTAMLAYFGQQQTLDMRQLVDWMRQMSFPLPEHAEEALVPLQKGSYPRFQHYPHFVVDYQIQERNRIAREEDDLAAKQALVAQLQAETKALDEAHRRWMEEKQHWLESEQSRRLDAIEREKQRIVTMKVLAAKTRERRLQQIIAMERNAKEALEQTSKLVAAEHDRYRVEMDFAAQKLAAHTAQQLDDEDISALEAAARARVARIADERLSEERLQQMRVDFFAQCRQQELADQIVFDSWKQQDRDAAATDQATVTRRFEEARKMQEDALFGEWQQKMQLQQMERARTMQGLKRARDGRHQKATTNETLGDSMTSLPHLESHDDHVSLPLSSGSSSQRSSSAAPAPSPDSSSSSVLRPPPSSTRPPAPSTMDRASMQPSPVASNDSVRSRTRPSPVSPVVLAAQQPAPPATPSPVPPTTPSPIPTLATVDVAPPAPEAPTVDAGPAFDVDSQMHERVFSALTPPMSASSLSSISASSDRQKQLLRMALEQVSSDEDDDAAGMFGRPFDLPPLQNHRLSAIEHDLKIEFSELGSDAGSLEQRPLSDLERDLEGMFSDDDVNSSSLSHLESLLHSPSHRHSVSAPVTRAPSPDDEPPLSARSKLRDLQSKLTSQELQTQRSVDEGLLAVGDLADLVPVKATAVAVEPFERDDEHERLMARAKALLREHQFRTN
ncbi:hypothetical protein SDRG_07443 [Saprolegnia diclina VS20]|uniref:TBC1 domain family member 31 n=1 Tax=Saprolegnia diclina (strain VS20) TaxID=1156394 RepID=T0QBD1_SAPDV|nr:hypothetical protein SDRG_07443 [Saprolegnia diclina VS20]EQC35214.1 hypothetical protein SDRG_07443 [Saprolegnia diclina VS20]|eukprot:XP_008611498.1 hypothetical protein SDRG_07443 [Saprolegnia diclina VS20]